MRYRLKDAGFTLIEIAIAVAILGVGLTTLISLQTRYTEDYIYEKHLTQAALYAQFLMTMIEVSQEPPSLGSDSEDLESALNEHNFFGAGLDEESQAAKDAIAGWKVTTEVSPLEIDQIDNLVNRIELTVSWSESPRDTFSLVYFAPSTEEDV
jgi:prepilin-type N-terminal cleavage/methylation domain-containing protein